MRTGRIRRLANAIEGHTIRHLGFNMNDWVSDHHTDNSRHNCNTTACIAGWAVALKEIDAKKISLLSRGKTIYAALWDVLFRSDGPSVADEAQEWLGLTNAQQQELFYHTYNRTTNKQAAAVLRDLAKTGKVDWYIDDGQ